MRGYIDGLHGRLKKMRTNIELNDNLVMRAFKCSGVKTLTELVDLSLREFVRQHEPADVRELRGKGMIDPAYSFRAARRRASPVVNVRRRGRG